MKKYIYKIFDKYFKQYKYNVQNGIASLIRASDTEILYVCLDEMNKVMEILAGRLTTVLDLPHKHMFPNSTQFNTFLQHMDVDLDKLFNSSKLIVNDIQNVVNYNSLERETISASLGKVQANVYSAYILSGKGLTGSTIIKESFNTQESANLLAPGAENVVVDTNSRRLTLKTLNTNPILDRSSLNYNFIDCSHSNDINKKHKIYPNNVDLALGSKWFIRNENYHFNDKRKETYRESILRDNIDPITSTGSCVFESVLTIDVDSKAHERIETEFAEAYQIPESFIFINRPISINSEYITTNNTDPDTTLRLELPFKNSKLSSSCRLILNPNNGNEYPSINDDLSFVRGSVIVDDNLVTQRIGIISSTPETEDEFGVNNTYNIMFNQPIEPEAIELVLNYNKPWSKIDEYYMSIWLVELLVDDVVIDYTVEDEETQQINIEYIQKVYLLVDTEDPITADNADIKNKRFELPKVKRLFRTNKGVK